MSIAGEIFANAEKGDFSDTAELMMYCDDMCSEYKDKTVADVYTVFYIMDDDSVIAVNENGGFALGSLEEVEE